MAELVVIRHAESTWKALGRWQGQADPPLSARGREQAKALAKAFSTHGIDGIVSSDLARAADTARILAAACGPAPSFDPRLRERELGRWTGLSEPEIAAQWPGELARLRAGDPALRPGGGESLVELAARVAEWLATVAGGLEGRRVAVVTHLAVACLLCPGTRLGNAEWCRVDLSGEPEGRAVSRLARSLAEACEVPPVDEPA